MDNDVEAILPPHSLDAEQGILCGLLHYPNLIVHAIGLLVPEHFYRPSHVEIYRAMLKCFEQEIPIEPIAVQNAAEEIGELDPAFSREYLNTLLFNSNMNVSVIDAYSLRYWAKILIDHARRRELIYACNEIMESAYNKAHKLYLEEAENLLYMIAQAFLEEESKQEEDDLDAAMQSLRDEQSRYGGITGLSTGFPSLDKSTHGFQPFQLITVSARPGGGKSAFALNVSVHVSIQLDRPVLYVSLEMSKKELRKRLIKQLSGTSSDLALMEQAKAHFANYQHNLLIEDTAGLTLSVIQSKILKAKKSHPDLALVVVDHIGLIASESNNRNQNRAYEIQQITSRFKTLSKTIQVPIMQLAQMNRQVDARQDKKPMLSDLRDSGSIEMDSDIVLFTHIDRDDNRKPTGVGSLTVAKHRDGDQLEIPMTFAPHLTLFKDAPQLSKIQSYF